MGHFKTRWQAAPILPRDASGKFKMQKLPEPGVGARAFDPESACVAVFSSWSIVYVPPAPEPGTPYDVYIWPASDTVLCDGDCLEWSLELSCPGAEPNVTMQAGADCVGVIIHVDGSVEDLAGCVATITPTLAGSTFGTPVTLSWDCVPECESFVVDFGDPFPEFLDEITPHGVSCTMVGDFCESEDTIILELTHSSDISHTVTPTGPSSWQVDLYANGTPVSLAGQTVTITATVAPGPAPVPICDPIILTCEA